MHVDYIARDDVELTDAVRGMAEKKLRKLEKYFNDILEVRLELAQERHLFSADAFIKGKDFDVKARAEAKELTTAIQETVKKLEIQARRSKTRLKDHKRGKPAVSESAGWNIDVVASSSIGEGPPEIIKTSRIPIKPMTIEEAALQLESSTNEFIVFRNAANDRINVLYRRNDSNLGLITPEL